jgi:WD repeat-containing protein 59
MSISPTSRDVVLAAYVFSGQYREEPVDNAYFSRRGLYIIDLEAPFEVPRFIPQGGTWDVAGRSPARVHTQMSTNLIYA